MSSLRTLLNKLTRGSERGALLRRNALMGMGVKVGSIACSLILVPMTINFVNPTQYGIWLTISSMVTWMAFFDIGFSNGLRNKLAEALAKGDNEQGRSYLSSTYVMLTLIFTAVLLVLLGLIHWVDIAPLLKVDDSYEPELKFASSMMAFYFCAGFILRTLSYVLKADMRTAYASMIDFIGQLGVLVVIAWLKETVEGSLSVLSLALTMPPLLTWIVASLVLYSRPYAALKPAIQYFRREDVKSLLNLGLKFFVIGIAFIIQFQTSNFLIARFFSVTEVTSYNIVYKYFNVMYMAFFIIIDPFWGAVTNAWSKGEHEWIKGAVKKYLKVAALWLAGGLLMLAVSPWVYDWWINRHVDEPVSLTLNLSAWMLAYVMCTIIGQIFCMFVNGIGALKIQFYTSLISPIVFVATTWLLARQFGLGMESVLIGSIAANFNGLILAPLQYFNVIHRKKQGIWTA